MGSVQHRGKGRWRARYRTHDGRERSRTFTRKSDAVRYLTMVEADKARGEWIDPRLGKMTYAAWAERWLAATVHLKPKTQAGYRSLLDRHVLPRFGEVELRSIDRVAVREWVAELQSRGLSPSRIRQGRQVLSASLAAAVESGYLTANPAANVKVPRERPREMRFLSAEQLEALADATTEPYDTVVYTLGYGGLRWGEAAALRRSRVDVLAGRLHVAESLAEVGGALHFGATKTHRARSVTVPRFLRERLGEHLGRWVGPEPDALVFTSPEGAPLRNSNFRRRVWLPALERAGIEGGLRIHELRHTAASLLIAQGAHPKAIQQHLGHSSITVTLDRYGHLFPSDLDALAERLEASRAAVLEQRAASSRPGDGPVVVPLRPDTSNPQ